MEHTKTSNFSGCSIAQFSFFQSRIRVTIQYSCTILSMCVCVSACVCVLVFSILFLVATVYGLYTSNMIHTIHMQHSSKYSTKSNAATHTQTHASTLSHKHITYTHKRHAYKCQTCRGWSNPLGYCVYVCIHLSTPSYVAAIEWIFRESNFEHFTCSWTYLLVLSHSHTLICFLSFSQKYFLTRMSRHFCRRRSIWSFFFVCLLATIAWM